MLACVHPVPMAQAWVTWSGSDPPAPRKCICKLAGVGGWPGSRPFPALLVLITALTHHCVMQPSLSFHESTSPSSCHKLCLCLWTHCHWGPSLSVPCLCLQRNLLCMNKWIEPRESIPQALCPSLTPEPTKRLSQDFQGAHFSVLRECSRSHKVINRSLRT